MTEFSIPPLYASIRVKAPLLLSFGVFTSGLGRWWPSSIVIGKALRKRVVLEPRLGGRWFEICHDGTRTDVAKVLLWEPPYRVVFLWQVNAAMQSDLAMKSELEIRFEMAGETRVQLTHEKFGLMGPIEGAMLRETLERVWPNVLDLFAARAEFEAAPL